MGVCFVICNERKKITSIKEKDKNDSISISSKIIKGLTTEKENNEIINSFDQIDGGDVYSEKNIPTTFGQKTHIINIENKKLKDFYNGILLECLDFEKDNNDSSYNEFRDKEYEQLKNEINNMREEFENYIVKMVNDKKINDIRDDEIKIIIENELTVHMIKQQIKKIIESYEKDINKYKIKHLKVILVGRKKIGKTDLINYMLELNHKEAKKRKKNFEEYTSESVPYLKLVEFDGIGFDKNSNPERIGNYIHQYINNLQKKQNEYDEYIHCIWYCMTETKFEAPEIAVLKKLKTSYGNDSQLPVIAVYTKTESDKIANDMENHIKRQGIDTEFIKTLAEDIELVNGKIKKSFGRKELLNATLQKCTEALQGKMIDVMTDKISEEIKSDMKKNNELKLKEIKEKIIDNFVSKFNILLSDGDFIDYIINVITNNLKDFYDGKIISNRSFNELNKSKFIESIKQMITSYKSKIKEKIDSIIEKNSKIFLELQAATEKKNCNMKVKNKRDLIEFKKTTQDFLIKNLYYRFQVSLIIHLIEKIYNVFFEDYNKKLEEITVEILDKKNNENNKDIKYLLNHCFLTKLKDFGESINIQIEIKKMIAPDELPEEKEIEHDEERIKNIELKLFNKFNNYKKDKKENNNTNLIDDKNWFPFELNQEWKKEDNISLNNFLENLGYQDSFFSKTTSDLTFNSLKDFIKQDLIIFFSQKRKEFIQKIQSKYIKQSCYFEKELIDMITKIIAKEKLSKIYDKQIENEIKIINISEDELKLSNITILILGRSGIGKSTLINGLLKEEMAYSVVGFRGTLQNDIYIGNNDLSFLTLIDTRGTELQEGSNLDKIVKNAEEFIEKRKLEAKTSGDYNKNIQCIYYCVKGGFLEDSELKAIEILIKNKESIPLIVVFTMGVNKKDINSMRSLIKKRFNNIPFISCLAKSNEDIESYGLDDLLELTLKVCQNSKNGNVYKAIQNKICKKVKIILGRVNDNIKGTISNKMFEKFIRFYNLVKDDELYKEIYKYLQIPFIEYMNFENENIALKEESIDEFKNLKSINEYIKEYINNYKNLSGETIKPILDEKSLDYLDMQVIKEKESAESIKEENKNTKKDFIKIITGFLSSNFYYISQIYLFYKLLLEIKEPFSEQLKKKMNEIIETNLKKNSSKKLIENTFDKIFEKFKERIYENSKNGKIYEKEHNEIGKSIVNYNIGYNNEEINTNNNENADNLECPYPYLDN